MWTSAMVTSIPFSKSVVMHLFALVSIVVSPQYLFKREMDKGWKRICKVLHWIPEKSRVRERSKCSIYHLLSAASACDDVVDRNRGLAFKTGISPPVKVSTYSHPFLQERCKWTFKVLAFNLKRILWLPSISSFRQLLNGHGSLRGDCLFSRQWVKK